MKSLLIYYLLVVTVLHSSIAYSTNALNCQHKDQNSRYNKGDTAVICVHFIPANDQSNALRLSFQVIVDKYTAVQARGAYNSFKTISKLSSVSIIAQADSNYTNSDNVTYLRSSTDPASSDIVIPIYSLVVNIENGKIIGTTWDNSCWDCTSNCYLDHINANSTQSNCAIAPCSLNNSNGTASCDPKIYVSWIGSDSKGNHMESAGLRISRFRQYSIGQMYSSALTTYDNILQSTKDSFNSNIGDNLNNLFGSSSTTFTVTTITFAKYSVPANGIFPYIYTKDGGSTIPGLAWSGVANAQSYAYFINHTNSTSSYYHYILKNIRYDVNILKDNDNGGGVVISNSFGVSGYSAPDISTTSQTYNFYIYALNSTTLSSTNVVDFQNEVEKYKIGVGSFQASYLNTKTMLRD